MMPLLDREMHLTLRVALAVAGVIIIALIWPARTPKPTPQATTALQDVVRAAKDAQEAVAAAKAIQGAAAPLVARPAVAIVQGADPRLSGAEWAAMLHALGTQPMQTVYRAQDTVAAPTSPPMPTAAPGGFSDVQLSQLEQADEVATATQLRKTTVQTHVTVSQEPAPPSRVSTVVASDGAAGVAFAVRRRGHVDVNLGVASINSHSEPLIDASYRIPGTGLGLGPSLILSTHGVRVGVAFHLAI